MQFIVFNVGSYKSKSTLNNICIEMHSLHNTNRPPPGTKSSFIQDGASLLTEKVNFWNAILIVVFLTCHVNVLTLQV